MLWGPLAFLGMGSLFFLKGVPDFGKQGRFYPSGPPTYDGWYFWTNLDYWPVFLDHFGILAGIFKVWIVLAGIFGQIWTSLISKVGWYFLVNMEYWLLFFDKFGLVLYFGWY